MEPNAYPSYDPETGTGGGYGATYSYNPPGDQAPGDQYNYQPTGNSWTTFTPGAWAPSDETQFSSYSNQPPDGAQQDDAVQNYPGGFYAGYGDTGYGAGGGLYGNYDYGEETPLQPAPTYIEPDTGGGPGDLDNPLVNSTPPPLPYSYSPPGVQAPVDHYNFTPISDRLRVSRPGEPAPVGEGQFNGRFPVAPTQGEQRGAIWSYLQNRMMPSWRQRTGVPTRSIARGGPWRIFSEPMAHAF